MFGIKPEPPVVLDVTLTQYRRNPVPIEDPARRAKILIGKWLQELDGGLNEINLGVVAIQNRGEAQVEYDLETSYCVARLDNHVDVGHHSKIIVSRETGCGYFKCSHVECAELSVTQISVPRQMLDEIGFEGEAALAYRPYDTCRTCSIPVLRTESERRIHAKCYHANGLESAADYRLPVYQHPNNKQTPQEEEYEWVREHFLELWFAREGDKNVSRVFPRNYVSHAWEYPSAPLYSMNGYVLQHSDPSLFFYRMMPSPMILSMANWYQETIDQISEQGSKEDKERFKQLHSAKLEGYEKLIIRLLCKFCWVVQNSSNTQMCLRLHDENGILQQIEPQSVKAYSDTWFPYGRLTKKHIQSPARQCAVGYEVDFEKEFGEIIGNKLNMAKGFRAVREYGIMPPVDYEPDLDAVEGADAIWEGIYKDLCNSQEGVFNYFKSYIAHIAKKPNTKTLVALLIISEGHGVGKDYYINKLLGSRIFGSPAYTQITDIDLAVDKFNEQVCFKVLINVDEVSKAAWNKEEKIRSMITREKVHYRKMYCNAVEIDDRANYIFTTNKFHSVRIVPEDRRFVVWQCGETHKGDHEYWDKMHKYLEDEEVLRHFWYTLMDHDITEFRPADRIPLTNEHIYLTQSALDPVLEFFQELALGLSQNTLREVPVLDREQLQSTNITITGLAPGSRVEFWVPSTDFLEHIRKRDPDYHISHMMLTNQMKGIFGNRLDMVRLYDNATRQKKRGFALRQGWRNVLAANRVSLPLDSRDPVTVSQNSMGW